MQFDLRFDLKYMRFNSKRI